MREVILNGSIGEKYGKHWKIKADRLSDIFQCIEANYPEFRKDIIELAESGAGFDVQCGDNFMGEEDLIYNLQSDTVIITPIPAGAKSGGAKILAAVAIVTLVAVTGGFGGAGFFGTTTTTGTGATATTTAGLSTAGQIATLTAINLAMAGITQMLAPDASVDDATADDKYLFNGPENTIPQNNVVPVLFGEMIVGGVVIASGTVSGLKNRGYTYTGSMAPGGNPGYDFETYEFFDTTGGGFTYQDRDII